MKRLALSVLYLLCLMASAIAQGITAIGPITPGNCVVFNSITIVKDSGVTCSGATGVTGPATSTLNGLPIWNSTNGTAVKDGAGQTIAGNYTWGGTQTYSATNTFNAAANFTSTFQIGGQTFTWPAAGTTVAGLGTSQTFTGANSFAPGNTTVNGNLFTNGGGLQMGSPTGGDKGAGTINVSSNLFVNGAVVGTVTSVVCNGLTFTVSGTCPPPYSFVNCAITASVASNNLTVTLTDNAGGTPSATSPCNIYYRNATQGTGSWTQVTTTAATTFTANSGSTFGSTNTTATCRAAASCPFKLWVVAINSGSGTVLGVVDLTNASGVNPLNEATLITTTACSACNTATAIGTVYSTAAQATKPFVILGYLEWGSGLATAGTWASAPTAIQTIGPGVAKPGQVIQSQFCCLGSVSVVTTSGTTFAAGANTNVTATITPTMASNPIRMTWSTTSSNSSPGQNFCQMADTSGPTAVGSQGELTTPTGGAAWPWMLVGGGYDTPGVTTAKTYAVRCWTSTGTSSTPALTANGAMEYIDEIMG
jgi:hypothetical protein